MSKYQSKIYVEGLYDLQFFISTESFHSRNHGNPKSFWNIAKKYMCTMVCFWTITVFKDIVFRYRTDNSWSTNDYVSQVGSDCKRWYKSCRENDLTLPHQLKGGVLRYFKLYNWLLNDVEQFWKKHTFCIVHIWT